jgi:1,2-phenylacetyl-CoA epoxidase catalytic subunit
LIDRIGRYQLEEFIGCSYAPIEPLLADIVQEELGHIDYGETQTRELAARGGQSKEKVQRALDRWYIKALDMFGHSVSQRSERYVHWGIKRRTNAQARAEYIKEVNPLIESMGLRVPDPLQGRHYL